MQMGRTTAVGGRDVALELVRACFSGEERGPVSIPIRPIRPGQPDLDLGRWQGDTIDAGADDAAQAKALADAGSLRRVGHIKWPFGIRLGGFTRDDSFGCRWFRLAGWCGSGRVGGERRLGREENRGGGVDRRGGLGGGRCRRWGRCVRWRFGGGGRGGRGQGLNDCRGRPGGALGRAGLGGRRLDLALAAGQQDSYQ